MAITSNTYTGNGSNKLFSITFPYLDTSDINVYLNGVLQTITTQYSFANATTVEFVTAPANGAVILLDRSTDDSTLQATFFPGSSIKANDLNFNFDQVLYLSQETANSAANQSTAGLQTQITAATATANTAITTANTANATANSANTTATGIAGTANTALSTANAAVVTANTASVTATNAESTANAISATANTALTNANAATVTANSALSTVSGLSGVNLNRIINGNFDIWQRGTSFTGIGYGADRWVNQRSGTTATQTRQPFTVGQTAVPNEPTYFCRTVVSSVAGASNYAALSQRIEDVRTFAGQQITISFWAKVDATKNISVELEQSFGTGGSPSANVNTIGVTKVSIGTSWQKVTVTITLPSISGKTLGTTSDSLLQLNIWFEAGSTYNARTSTLGQQSGTFDIAQVQVESGAAATPFEQRPIGTELALCERYFHTGSFYGWNYTTGASNQRVASVYFPSQMRAYPSVVFLSASGTNATGQTAEGITPKHFGIFTGALGAGNINFEGTYSASAEL
jgi:hypothetical protein